MLQTKHLVAIIECLSWNLGAKYRLVYLVCRQQLEGSYLHQETEDYFDILGCSNLEQGQENDQLLSIDHVPEVLERRPEQDVEDDVASKEGC